MLSKQSYHLQLPQSMSKCLQLNYTIIVEDERDNPVFTHATQAPSVYGVVNETLEFGLMQNGKYSVRIETDVYGVTLTSNKHFLGEQLQLLATSLKLKLMQQ